MESDTPIELLVSRVWNGTKWHYPNIERMVEEKKRLRAELAAAIKQRDALAAHRTLLIAECDGLRSDRQSYQQIKDDLIAELAAMRKQRDEARRMICEDESYNHKSGVTPREVAEDRGWDCFAKKEGGGA